MPVKKLGFLLLLPIVIGSMVGSGAFSLPQNMAMSAGGLGLIIGWIITTVGILGLAFSFQALSTQKPKLTGGVYSYAKAFLGEYVGFQSSWGYWFSCWIGNVAYLLIIFSTLGIFFPIFKNGTTSWALLGEVVVLAVFHILALSGTNSSAKVNLILTVLKMLGILVFIVAVIIGFNGHQFSVNMQGGTDLGTLFTQIKGTMLVTLFAFLGIEGAVVMSDRAKSQRSVGWATVIGLLIVVAILILMTVLSYGIMPLSQLGGLTNPSTAPIMVLAVGSWAKIFIAIVVLVSVLGAFISFILLGTEIIYVGAKDKAYPRIFSKTSKNGTPIWALWLTNIVTLLFIILANYVSQAYVFMISLCASMALFPYFLSCFYSLFVSSKGGIGYLDKKGTRIKDIIWSVIGSLYTLWMLYAGGLKFLLLGFILYAIGTILYIIARKEQGKKVFNNAYEIILFLIITGLGVLGVVFICVGIIKVF